MERRRRAREPVHISDLAGVESAILVIDVGHGKVRHRVAVFHCVFAPFAKRRVIFAPVLHKFKQLDSK